MKLTDKERATLNAAAEILERYTAQGASWALSGGKYDKLSYSYDLVYFDSNPGGDRGQHNWVKGATLADKIQTVLEIEENAAKTAEENRAKRVERLKRELAQLTGEAA